MLKASFVRTVGDRDRIYVVRSDGSEVNGAFPAYGDALPHDLTHLVVEAAFETFEEWNRGAGSAELPERLHPKVVVNGKPKVKSKRAAKPKTARARKGSRRA